MYVCVYVRMYAYKVVITSNARLVHVPRVHNALLELTRACHARVSSNNALLSCFLRGEKGFGYRNLDQLCYLFDFALTYVYHVI